MTRRSDPGSPMSLRSLITLLGVFLVVSLGLWVAWLNPDPVTFRLPGFPPRSFEPPLWVIAFLSLVLGVFAALLYSVVLSSKEAFSRWRLRREQRSEEENAQLVREGLEHAVRGDHRGALDRFDEVLENDPKHLDAWIQGGEEARRLGNVDRAVDMHVRARGLAPEDPRVHGALAADFAALGEPARAVSHLEQRIAHLDEPGADDYRWLRELLVEQRRWDEAIDAQERRLKLLDDDVLRVDEEAILRGLRLEKGHAQLERDGAEGADAAAAIFDSLLRDDPQFVPAYLLLGEARLAQDDPDGAIKTWLDGVEKTHSLPLLDHLVEYYLEAGQPEAALKVSQRAVEELEGTDELAARLELALLYARLEMLDEAQAGLRELEEQSEYSPVLRYYLARLRQRQGDDREAASIYREVVESAGIPEPDFRCSHCGARFEDYRLRCVECGRWGTIDLDTAQDIRLAEEPSVSAPRI